MLPAISEATTLNLNSGSGYSIKKPPKVTIMID
jgi:hypothetical protein